MFMARNGFCPGDTGRAEGIEFSAVNVKKE
jgi:hypothetical protein